LSMVVKGAHETKKLLEKMTDVLVLNVLRIRENGL